MTFTTFLVDDDPGVLKALSRVVRSAGYNSVSYSSGREFLQQSDPSTPGCAIIDLTMPELDGLELQQCMIDSEDFRPIIFLTGQGDIPASVSAMQAGAVDFLTKPIQCQNLLSAIEKAVQRHIKAREAYTERKRIEEKLARLTPRERQVLDHVVAGKLNKQTAAYLGTVEKTVKVHRARMMAKLEVRSVADLVRMVERAKIKA